MVLWVFATIITVVCVLWVIRPLLRPADSGIDRATFDIQVYKDQLAELDKSVAKGLISADDAESTRIEISRRLLAAVDKDGQEVSGAAPKQATRAVAVLIVLLSVLGGFGLYTYLGSPEQPDMPLGERLANISAARDARPSQDAAEARVAEMTGAVANAVLTPEQQRYTELVAQLEKVLKDRPNEIEGFRLLAQAQLRLERYAEARQTLEYILTLLGDSATPKDLAETVNVMVIATNGYVSPEAEALLTRALKMDPRNQMVRYYSGLSLAQTGRSDLAYPIWVSLVTQPDVDPVWREAVLQDLPSVAAVANRPMPDVPTARAPMLSGPSAEDMEAAADMTADERKEMITNMVNGLMERLATEGGTPQEWARLIGALYVLGRNDDADAILAEARQNFANSPEALSIINQAAQ